VDRAGDLATDRRQLRDPGEEVAAHGREQPDAGGSGRELREDPRERRGLGAIRDRRELLELIDEHDHAAALGAPELAGDRRRIIAQARLEGFVELELVDEQRRERGQRTRARHERDHRPRLALGRELRQHPGPAQRRLAHTRVPGDEHERITAQALDDRADIRAATEEQRAVLRLEGQQAAVRIALGDLAAEHQRLDLLERFAQLVARSEP
jgi:hypothetical protein